MLESLFQEGLNAADGAWTTLGVSFVVVLLAEIGDKSQIVCMSLAARHRGSPVLLGAAAAFLVLNLLAVLFGAGLAGWLPEQVLTVLVALLFAGFGVQALLHSGEEDDEEVSARPGRSVFLSTFLLILVAEFGDKTQITVAGFAGVAPPLMVWMGASVALLLSSAMGVWAGRTVLQRLPVQRLHQAAGVLFLLLAAVALWQGFA